MPLSAAGCTWLVQDGDPDLLTFRALRLMQRADVVYTIGSLLQRLLISCVVTPNEFTWGKEKSNHVVPQGEINQLLLELARGGKSITVKVATHSFSVAAAGDRGPGESRYSVSVIQASPPQQDAHLMPAFR